MGRVGWTSPPTSCPATRPTSPSLSPPPPRLRPRRRSQSPAPSNAVRYRGLTGDVFLTALPQGPQVEAIGIRTSVSPSRWQVLVDLRGLKAGQAYNLQAQALDADGKPAAELNKSFNGVAHVATMDLAGGWDRPHLWEPSDPYRYRCVVRLRDVDGKLLDEYAGDFGFREFRIDGGDFRLNGRKIRLRPNLVWGTWEPFRYLCPVILRAEIAGYQSEGFNTLQYWPSDFPQALEHLAEECDRAGMLLILPLESMANNSARLCRREARPGVAGGSAAAGASGGQPPQRHHVGRVPQYLRDPTVAALRERRAGAVRLRAGQAEGCGRRPGRAPRDRSDPARLLPRQRRRRRCRPQSLPQHDAAG